MADAQIQQSKDSSFGKKIAAVSAASNIGPPKKVQSSPKPSGSKITVSEKDPNKSKSPEQSDINNEVLHVLKDLSTKITAQNKRIEKQDERIDTIIQKMDSYYEYEACDNEDFDVSQYSDDDIGVAENEEQVSKKQKTESKCF